MVRPLLGDIVALFGCLCCGFVGGAWYSTIGQSGCKGAVVLGCLKMMSSLSVVSSAMAVSESRHCASWEDERAEEVKAKIAA
jgi:hypothetical protein